MVNSLLNVVAPFVTCIICLMCLRHSLRSFFLHSDHRSGPPVDYLYLIYPLTHHSSPTRTLVHYFSLDNYLLQAVFVPFHDMAEEPPYRRRYLQISSSSRMKLFVRFSVQESCNSFCQRHIMLYTYIHFSCIVQPYKRIGTKRTECVLINYSKLSHTQFTYSNHT